MYKMNLDMADESMPGSSMQAMQSMAQSSGVVRSRRDSEVRGDASKEVVTGRCREHPKAPLSVRHQEHRG